jgi:predicted solute-binding protein
VENASDKPEYPYPIPKLRMAPKPGPEDLARTCERERRLVEGHRESELEKGLAPFKVGSVSYLNSVPLTRGLEKEVRFDTPAKLAKLLDRGELDAALVSVVEVLFKDRYDVLDGIAIASLGEVYSVILAHRKPIEEATAIYCDCASLTSVQLLRILLAERGVHPEFKSLENYESAKHLDYVLLIGNPAIRFRRQHLEHETWDLGAGWYDLTKLPFVYAVWALRRGIDNEPLKRQLREAKNFGLDTLDYIVESNPEFDRDFRRDYLGWHIHYHLGSDEKRGLARFIELLKKHTDATIVSPVFVK